MNETITDRLTRFIKFMGLTHEEFSASIGMKRSTFSNKIQGSRNIDITMLVNILNTYPNLDANWLISGIGEMEKIKVDEQFQSAVLQMLHDVTTKNEEIAAALEALRKGKGSK